MRGGGTHFRRLRPAEVSLREGEILILESHHDVGFEMDLGVWPFRKICWVAVGKGHLEGETGSTPIAKDDFLLIPSAWPHRFTDDPKEPLTLVILCLSDRLFLHDEVEWGELWNTAISRNEVGVALRACTAFHRGGLIEILRSCLREQSRRRRGWRTILKSSVGDLLTRLARGECEAETERSLSSERAVAGAIDYLDEIPYMPHRIEDMATKCGLSPRRFTELFKKLSGETFNRYVTRKRIEYSRERLKETGHILYACYESGFNDVAYFYRVFKKQTGLTPGQYLKSERG